MANDKAEPAKINDTQAPQNDSQVAHLPSLVELAGGVGAGLRAARDSVRDKIDGVKQLGEQTVNATTGAQVFSKESIDALGPKEHEHAKAYTTNWYFEQAGQALPLVAAVTVGHKLFGAFGAKEAVQAEKTTAEVTGFGADGALKRAASLSLRQTPLGLNVRNAAAIGFASEFANPTDTKNNDSLLSSLGTRTLDGSIGAASMATMSLGTIGTQAAFRAVGKAIFKEAATTAAESAALSAETMTAKVPKNVFASAAESTFNKVKSVGGNAIIAGIGGMPGGVVGYIAGAEAHGQSLSFSDLKENAVSSGVVGGLFGAASGLRGNAEVRVKSDKTVSDTPSTPFSARLAGATEAVRDMVFGRQSDAGQLGTAMASDAKGRVISDSDRLAKSWDSYMEFAGGKGRVDAADVEDVLKRVDSGKLKASTLQFYADGGNSAEQHAFVAASLRPESRAAFLKMMEVSRDGSAAAQNGFVQEFSGDKQTIADLQLMTGRINDAKLSKIVDATANHVVESAAPKVADIPDIRAAASIGSTPIDFDAATAPKMSVKTNIADEALRQPVADGFVQLLDAAKNTGTPEHMAAFFRAVDANPKILDGVKEMANQTPLQSVKDLVAMSEKPALRQAVMQLVEAAKDGSSVAQKQAFIDTVGKDRSTLTELKKLAERYNDPRIKELVRAADTADVELVVGTQKEANDLKLATKVIENLVASGGADTTDLNKIVRDDDSLANLQPHLRHIAERLGGEEVAKKVDEAFAGRFQKVEVHTPGDESLPKPEEVQTVSVRSNLVKDFNQMTEIVQMLDEALTKPQQEGDPVNPDWIYNLLKVKAQTETGKALEASVKEYAQKTFDPRFQAFVNDAYLPPEGIVLGPERTFAAASAAEQNAFGSFATVMKGWPKVAAGEIPNRDDVLNYRAQVFKYLGEHPELHEMVLRYGQQTNSSFEASAIDTYYGTKNLERFPGVVVAKEAAPPESATLRGFRDDPVANTLVNGSLDSSWAYLKDVSEHLAQPAAIKGSFSTRMFNDQPRVSQDNPVPGAGTWSVAEFEGTSVATITGHPENLQKIQDFADGTRIEIYGRNGETEPYTQVYWPDNSNVKVVNPGVDGTSRFKIEFPLQGNYISTDFPADSKVAREISWDGNLTQINRDGSVGMQKNEDFKKFDPVAYDNARKLEIQTREIKAETARNIEIMKTSPNQAERLKSANAVKPEYMSDEQFQDWLKFAFRKSPDTGAPNYHELNLLGKDGARLESMRTKLVASFDVESARLKDYLSVPEAQAGKVPSGASYPEWLSKKNVEALPNWLKSDIYQRFYAKGGVSDKLPSAVVEYFGANPEPNNTKAANDRFPAKSFPFDRIGNDSVEARLRLLDDLNLAQPEVAARLMELGSKDGLALDSVIKNMTKPFNNSAEYRDLVSSTLANAKDIYSVKLMLDALDKAKDRSAQPDEKLVSLGLAKEAASSITGLTGPISSSVQRDIQSIYDGRVTRLPSKGPKLERGAKGPQEDKTMLAMYTLTPPDTSALSALPDELFPSAPEAPEPAGSKPADTTGDASDSASVASSSPADLLRGASPLPAEGAEAPATPEAKVDQPEPPADAVEPPLPPEAEALSTKIGEKLTEAGPLGGNTVYETESGREFLIEPSGATYERGLDKIGGQLWKNVDDNTEIWTDARQKLWDYNSESNFAVVRDVPEGVRRQVLTFADDGSDSENRHPDSPHLAPRENVLSTFRNDGSVEFAFADGSKHTLGARDTAGRPSFETFEYPAGDSAEGLKVRVTANQAVDGILPNGVKFSAADLSGKATIFTYPDGVAPFDAGSTINFDKNILTVTEGSGKQTVFHSDGSVEVHLPEPEPQPEPMFEFDLRPEEPSHEPPDNHGPS